MNMSAASTPALSPGSVTVRPAETQGIVGLQSLNAGSITVKPAETQRVVGLQALKDASKNMLVLVDTLRDRSPRQNITGQQLGAYRDSQDSVTRHWVPQVQVGTQQRSMSVEGGVHGQLRSMQREIRNEMQEATKQIEDHTAEVKQARHEVRKELAAYRAELSLMQKEFSGAMLRFGSVAQDVAILQKRVEYVEGELKSCASSAGKDHQDTGGPHNVEPLACLLERVAEGRRCCEVAIAQEVAARCVANEHIVNTMECLIEKQRQQSMDELHSCERRLANQLTIQLQELEVSLMGVLRRSRDETDDGLFTSLMGSVDTNCKSAEKSSELHRSRLSIELDALRKDFHSARAGSCGEVKKVSFSIGPEAKVDHFMTLRSPAGNPGESRTEVVDLS